MRDTERPLERLNLCRVLVARDLMLGQYRRGPMERISPEGPAPILRVGVRKMLGGGGNVNFGLCTISPSEYVPVRS